MIRQLKIISILFFPLVIFALPSDKDVPMQIVADSSLINYKTGVNTYQGHVKIDQGTTHLTAERLITKTDVHHKLVEASAYGNQTLAEYTTIPKAGDKPLHAKANFIHFLPEKSTVELIGNVLITQGENSFHGRVIIYNIKDQTVTAPATKFGNTTIIIEPKQLS